MEAARPIAWGERKLMPEELEAALAEEGRIAYEALAALRSSSADVSKGIRLRDLPRALEEGEEPGRVFQDIVVCAVDRSLSEAA